MSERDNNMEAGRSGRGTRTIPRGVEVLLKKAAVDANFRNLLFEHRASDYI